jgi:hypothetical protein
MMMTAKSAHVFIQCIRETLIRVVNAVIKFVSEIEHAKIYINLTTVNLIM